MRRQYRWFNDDRWYDLLVIMDDATSEIYYAQLVEHESTRTVLTGIPKPDISLAKKPDLLIC